MRFNRVDVNFFRTFEVPILAGRGFEPADIASAGAGSASKEEPPEGGAVVVNQPFAQQIFGGNALGRRIRYVDRSRGAAAQNVESGRWYEIVGIVSDFPTGVSPGMRDSSSSRCTTRSRPARCSPRPSRFGCAAALPRPSPNACGRSRQRSIPTSICADILGLDEALRSEQWISRMEAAVFVAVTLSVLMLSSAGIYALMSFTVSQRRKEIGIRMALGADWKRIVASIFSRALRTACRRSGARRGLGSRARESIGGRSHAGQRGGRAACRGVLHRWRWASWRRSAPPAAACGSSRLRR